MNGINEQKRYYRLMLLGACFVILVAILGGRRLRQNMISEVAEQTGKRIAALYELSAEDGITRIASVLQNSEKEIEMIVGQQQDGFLYNWMGLLETEIEKENDFNQVELFLVLNGRLAVRKDGKLEYSSADSLEWYQAALQKKGEVYFTDVYQPEEGGENQITAAQINPVTRNGIGFHSRLQDVAIGSDDADMIRNMRYILCDSDWNEIRHMTNQTGGEPEEMTQENLKVLQKEYLKLCGDSSFGGCFTRDWKGQKVYIYCAELSTGWMSIVLFPQNSLTTEFRGIWGFYYAVIGLCLALLLILGYVMNRRRNIRRNVRIVNSMADMFYTDCYISLKDKACVVLKESNERVRRAQQEIKNADQIGKRFSDACVTEEFRERTADFFNLDTLPERLKGRRFIDCECCCEEIGWCRLTFIPVETKADGTVESVLFAVTDIDKSKRTELALQEEKEHLSEIVQASALMFDRFFVVNLEKDTCYYSYASRDSSRHRTRISDTTALQVFQENARCRFCNPDDREQFITREFTKEGMRELLKNDNDYYFEYMDLKSDNIILGATMYCLERKNGIPVRVVFAMRDISDAKRSEQNYKDSLREKNRELKRMADHDNLTGLYNRNGLRTAVRPLQQENIPIALLLLDVDHFKQINDGYGHSVGDQLLVHIAHVLQKSFRAEDILVRMGGDEFMALLLNCGVEQSDMIMRKIAEINAKLQRSQDGLPPVSLSVGAAFSCPGEGKELVDRADAALYEVKKQGRCNCCIYEKMESKSFPEPGE